MFGLLVADVENVDHRLDIAEDFGVKLIRASCNSLEDYREPKWLMERCRDRDFSLIYNINYSSRHPYAYPTDMLKYGDMVKHAVSHIDKTVTKVCVIENEPTNEIYHIVDIDKYKRMLDTAIPIIQGAGMKVTSGGNPNSGKARIMAYKWVLDTQGQIEADNYAMVALTGPGQLNTAKWWAGQVVKRSPEADMQKRLTNEFSLLQHYAQTDMDYMNFHWYEPIGLGQAEDESPDNVMQTVYSFLSYTTMKPVISNETGQHNESPLLVESMLKKIAAIKPDYNIWYDGTGDNAFKLTLSKDQYLNGNAYRDTIRVL